MRSADTGLVHGHQLRVGKHDRTGVGGKNVGDGVGKTTSQVCVLTLKAFEWVAVAYMQKGVTDIDILNTHLCQ